MDIGLIIQGPMISGGLSGATWGKGKTRAPRDSFVEFNCEKQLITHLREIRKYFPITTIATWDHYETQNLQNVDSNVVILKKPEPVNSEKLLRKPIKGMPDVAHNNRYKQFELIELAMDFLCDVEGVTHFLKIRTDQTFDWRRLRKEAELIFQNYPNRFFLPYRHEGLPFLFPDFYFGGSIEVLRDTLRFIGNKKFFFHNNVHRDMALKFLFMSDPIRHLEKYPQFFLTSDSCSNYIAKELELIFESRIALGSRELFYSMSWRGEEMKNNNISFKFSNDICAPGCAQITQQTPNFRNFLNHNYQIELHLIQVTRAWIWEIWKLNWKKFRILFSATRQRTLNYIKNV